MAHGLNEIDIHFITFLNKKDTLRKVTFSQFVKAQ